MKLFGYLISIEKIYTLYGFLEEVIRLDTTNRDKVVKYFDRIYRIRAQISLLETQTLQRRLEWTINLLDLDDEQCKVVSTNAEGISQKNREWWKNVAQQYSLRFKHLTTDEEKAMLGMIDTLGPLYKTDDVRTNLELLIILFSNIFTNNDRKELMAYMKRLQSIKQ